MTEKPNKIIASPEVVKLLLDSRAKLESKKLEFQKILHAEERGTWDNEVIPLLGDEYDPAHQYFIDNSHEDIGILILTKGPPRLPATPPQTEEQRAAAEAEFAANLAEAEV